MVKGKGYFGSPAIEVSKSNHEIVPTNPILNNYKYELFNFHFINKSDCHIKINGGSPIFISANQGFATLENDAGINSFVIVESGISFQFMASHY